MKSKRIYNMVVAAMCLALCLFLPFLTGQIPEIGNLLSPMHIPVLLCGFLCGWQYGLLVGFVAPLLRYVCFGMPPIFPTGVAMAFELAAYGALTGALYAKLPRKPINIYVTLIVSMLAGRVVWGVVRFILSGLVQTEFTWNMFMAGAFINAVPGILCHVFLIPLIVMALERASIVKRKE